MSNIKSTRYECLPCDYSTNIRYNYDKHLKTRKHILINDKYVKNKEKDNQVNNDVDDKIVNNASNNRVSKLNIMDKATDNKIIKINPCQCRWCNQIFANQGNLARHKKSCAEKTEVVTNYENKIEKLQLELTSRDSNYENKIEKLQMELTHKDHLVRTLQETIEYERIREKSHLSASNYLMVAYNSAPPLLPLTDFTIFEEEDVELLDLLLSAHRNNEFAEFVGRSLVHYYKKSDPRDQQLWNSDNERLTYFIRKNLKWTIDKQGIKTCDFIIDPALKYFTNILRAFINSDIPKESTDAIIADNKCRAEALQLMMNINNGTMQQKILKFIAPYLYLDKELKHVPKLTTKNLEQIKRKRITDK